MTPILNNQQLASPGDPIGRPAQLTVADGTLPLVPTAIFTGHNNASRYNITLSNNDPSWTTQYITLAISRNGGTPRRFRNIVLDAMQSADVVGLAITSLDSLVASTSAPPGQVTAPGSVSYIIEWSAVLQGLNSHVYDASGCVKGELLDDIFS